MRFPWGYADNDEINYFWWNGYVLFYFIYLLTLLLLLLFAALLCYSGHDDWLAHVVQPYVYIKWKHSCATSHCEHRITLLAHLINSCRLVSRMIDCI